MILLMSNVPLDAKLFRRSVSVSIGCPSFSHIILVGDGEPFTRQFSAMGSFLRPTVSMGSLIKSRGTKGPGTVEPKRAQRPSLEQV